VPFANAGLNNSMPAALIETPAVHKSGPYQVFPRAASLQPVQPPPLRIPSSTASPAAPAGGFGLPETPESRYEVLSELGRGGMGVVHKALDRKLGRSVALKILPWQLRGDETAMRYFKREAKAIAALNHPNIVALYDYGEGFGSLYLAMEYLEGPNLQKLIKGDPERVRKNWRSWFVQAARGIAAAHAKGILHRDLKPANLILDEHETLRILDFGLALPEAEAGGTSKLIGSPAFFPPEVLRGEMPSTASDVYSLGAAFYTLATGRWPYIGEDVLVARLERDPDDPRPYAPFLKEGEVAIVMRTLARHRPDRYLDGGELLAALLGLEA
jgi:serine/threonine-protein kinase